MDFYQIMHECWAKPHLDYLASTHYAIVSRFEESLRYVSLDSRNGGAYSYEFASILRDVGSAFGSFSDGVVRDSNHDKTWEKRPPNIVDFFEFYSRFQPEFPKTYIDVRGISGPGYRLQPFWGWTEKHAPPWWEAHNNLKHSEYKNAVQGNLRNATNAVAAIEIVLRVATLNQVGTELFHNWGGIWEPGQAGTAHIQLLFDP
jgi:hypothetical protein